MKPFDAFLTLTLRNSIQESSGKLLISLLYLLKSISMQVSIFGFRRFSRVSLAEVRLKKSSNLDI